MAAGRTNGRTRTDRRLLLKDVGMLDGFEPSSLCWLCGPLIVHTSLCQRIKPRMPLFLHLLTYSCMSLHSWQESKLLCVYLLLCMAARVCIFGSQFSSVHCIPAGHAKDCMIASLERPKGGRIACSVIDVPPPVHSCASV